MHLEARDLPAEIQRPLPRASAAAGVPVRAARVVPDLGANRRRVGTPWWMQPSDYPLAVPATATAHTAFETTNEFWLAVRRLTAIAHHVVVGQSPFEPSDRFPLLVRIRDASRRFPLVPDWAPLECIAGVGRSGEGELPGPGWVIPPNTTVLVELRNLGALDLEVFVQAEAARILFEGEGGGA